jgi:hypothetical protein
MGCKNCYRHIILVKFCTKERFKGTVLWNSPKSTKMQQKEIQEKVYKGLSSEILQNPPR